MANPEESLRAKAAALPGGAVGFGSLGIGSIVLWMLINQGQDIQEMEHEMVEGVNALRTEFNLMRQSMAATSSSIDANLATLRADYSRMDKDVGLIRTEMDHVKRIATDPRARPDAWTRSDDNARMAEFRDYMKAYADSKCREMAEQVRHTHDD